MFALCEFFVKKKKKNFVLRFHSLRLLYFFCSYQESLISNYLTFITHFVIHIREVPKKKIIIRRVYISCSKRLPHTFIFQISSNSANSVSEKKLLHVLLFHHHESFFHVSITVVFQYR